MTEAPSEISEQDLFSMIMQAPAAIAIVHGPNHIFKVANPIYQKIFGRAQLKLIGKSIHEVWPEAKDQNIIQIFDEVFTTGKPFIAASFPAKFFEHGVERLGYFDFIAQPIADAKNRITDIFIHAVDVTEKVIAHQQVQLSEERFRGAINAVEGILWTNNAEGKMVGEQPGWAQLTGQQYDEYQGYGWARVVHPDDAQPTIDAWNIAVAARKPFVFEHRVLCKDGEWRLFSIKAIPVFEEDGNIREWVGVHTDITERRAVLLDVQRAKQRMDFALNAADMVA